MQHLFQFTLLNESIELQLWIWFQFQEVTFENVTMRKCEVLGAKVPLFLAYRIYKKDSLLGLFCIVDNSIYYDQ